MVSPEEQPVAATNHHASMPAETRENESSKKRGFGAMDHDTAHPKQEHPIGNKKLKDQTSANMASLRDGLSSTSDQDTVDTRSPRERVLGTTELLEAILFELDTKTLLLSQRVDRMFKATIDHSTILQEALFFKLAAKAGHRFGKDGLNDVACGFDGKLVTLKTPTHTLDFVAGTPGGWPHLPHYMHSALSIEIDGDDEGCFPAVYLKVVRHDNTSVYDVGEGNESWRRMYLFQTLPAGHAFIFADRYYFVDLTPTAEESRRLDKLCSRVLREVELEDQDVQKLGLCLWFLRAGPINSSQPAPASDGNRA